ncbi:MAG TPA: hypothetical protein VGN57_06915 [Pirellulaceae bacterium]|jgi:hypothetical protein|nr:hypothetical protein [Pirellulaceae bacterium]
MKRFALAGLIVVACFAVVGVGIAVAMRQAEDGERVNRSKSVHVAFQNYDSHFQRLPRNIIAADGALATSWRLDLLPFTISMKRDWDREQPWTAEINTFFREFVHWTYCNDTTNSRVFAVLPEMIGDDENASRGLTGLPPETLLFLETRRDSDIHWMEPRDLTLDEALSPAMCPPGEHVFVTFADGQIWKLTAESKNELQRFIDPAPGLPNDERQRALARFGRWMNPPSP